MKSEKIDGEIATPLSTQLSWTNNLLITTVNKTVDEDDYPNTRILDTYSLKFLDLPNEFSEKDLKNAIIKNLKAFISEVGKDFTFK